MWAGDPNYPIPEGFPCECGLMLYHTEKCKECGSIINKPQIKTSYEVPKETSGSYYIVG